MADAHFVCMASEVTPGAAKIVKVKKHSVGVFQLSDGLFALLNVCPHRGAALCEGPVCGTTRFTENRDFVYERAGEIVRCAWHGWEFDIRTGQSLVDEKMKARSLPVTVEDEKVFVHL
jgi:nitrite reductase (NADH) small subunit